MTARQKQPSDGEGLTEAGKPTFLAVGKLRRPHGVRGEILMEVLTDFPERLKRGMTLFVGPTHQKMRLSSLRSQDQALLVSFRGLKDSESAGELRNQMVYVRAEDRPPLPEGEYYHHQLIGLQVVNEDGAPLGVVKEILETGANDVYVVLPPDGPEILLPATNDVILEIDLAGGRMQVHILPGLLAED
jgi:16S rRNA processing protein RimM